MSNNWLLKSVFVIVMIASPVVVTAQVASDCGGNCGPTQVGSDFFQNSTAANAFPACPPEGCPQLPCEPAVCCGPYVSLFGGLTTFDNFEFEIATGAGVVEERSLDADEGYAFGFAIGEQFLPRARAEFEVNYSDSEFDAFGLIETTTANGVSTITNSETELAVGDIETIGVMANVLYDFSPRCIGRFNLYGGGGVGAIYANGTAVTATRSLNVNDASFAYQIIAGANRPINQRVDVFAEYRFVHASTLTVVEQIANQNLGGFQMENNNLFFGMRFRR